MRIAVVMGGVLIAAAPNAAAQSNTAAIDVRGNAFIPSPITVLVGTTVTWTQRDTIEHTVTVDDNQPEDWQHGILLPMNAAGALNEFEHTFQNLGTTSYHCEVHTNMIGEVIVVESFHSPFVTVNANDANEFSPEQVQTNVTDGVLWINSGTLQHTVTFEDSSIGDLGVIDEGEPIRFNFTAPGSYRYRCTYHSGNDFETGMVGKVVVGGNASFPTVLLIEEPSENATVNDTLNVTGRLIQGEGQAAVTDLEYRLDENTNWTDINTTDLKEFRWAFSVDITNLVLGIHTIQVRALAGESEVASDSRTVVIEAAPPPHRAGEGNGSASPSLLLVLVALLAFVVVERNRRSR
ncbi:MAG TPA: plastocyanin/azurin family copper-binding protein [Candidatus Thermoplasmatota archaeon]